MKKTKKKGIGKLFYYANPSNLSKEVAGLGYKLSVRKMMLLYLAYIGCTIVAGRLFGLNAASFIAVLAAGIFFMPIVTYNSFRNRYEQQRFSDVSEYMEHFLYSFRANHKILQSLKEVEMSFRDGPMKDTILEAEKELLHGTGKGTIERNGLGKIEERYPCQRLHAIHKFAIEVERIGGAFDASIDLLLEDRAAWVDRTTEFQRDKKSNIQNVVFSLVATAGVCLFVQRMLPDTVDLPSSPIIQVAILILLIGELVIYAVADSKMATDWLEAKGVLTDAEVRNYYKKVTARDKQKEKKHAIVVSAIGFLLFAAAGFIMHQNICYAISVLWAIVCLTKPMLSYRSAKKALETEISIKFPQWLMGISLQLQSENVQNAIFNSIPTAPEVLKPALKKMQDSLVLAPESPEPYLRFMPEFNVPEIQSSMTMLYSISAGTGGDSKKQINEIIHRNNMLLDKAEKKAFSNTIGGLYALFLAPQLFGAVKLTADMIVFFGLFMGQVGI